MRTNCIIHSVSLWSWYNASYTAGAKWAASHALRCSPHPWTGHRSPAPIMKPTASADTEIELTELLVGMDILWLCTCQGHGEKHFLLPQNQAKGKSFFLHICFFFLPFLPLSLSLVPFFLLLTLPPTSPLLDFISSQKYYFLLCVQAISGSIISNEIQNDTSIFSFLDFCKPAENFPEQKGQQGGGK